VKAFTGRVQFRSSVKPDGPPGESEILSLNPQRRVDILRTTGWSRLEDGTLNLIVRDDVVDGLLEHKPLLIEDAKTVVYPSQWKHVPLKREAYYYYRATAVAKGKRQEVLVRRAKVALPRRVELFAPISLKQLFPLADRDRVVVEIPLT
jgi:hypothetical protein